MVSTPDKLQRDNPLKYMYGQDGDTERQWGHPLIAFATDTVYGVGCLLGDRTGLDHLYALKQRPADQPAQLLVSSRAMAMRYALIRDHQPIDAASRLYLLRAQYQPFWDGRLVKQGKISLRCPNHAALCAQISTLGIPLVASSANRRGQPPLLSAVGVRQEFSHIPLIIHDDETLSGQPSAIWDMSVDPPICLR